jgi:hypothetical protein
VANGDGSTCDGECGPCNDNITEGACDCDDNVDMGCGCGLAGPSGCDSVCGSTAVVDECDVCGGDGSLCDNWIIIPDDFITIQDGIDSASPGDTIVVDGDASAIYTENIVLNKNVAVISRFHLDAIDANVWYDSVNLPIINAGGTMIEISVDSAELSDISIMVPPALIIGRFTLSYQTFASIASK